MTWSNQMRTVGTRAAWALAALLAGAPVALAQDGSVTVVVPINGSNTITPNKPGYLLFTYLGVVIKWVTGLVGAALFCAIVYYGVLLMFSGVEETVTAAKKGILASVGGMVLLMTSGLVLYTLNPTYFRGFGAECTGGDCGEVLGQEGAGNDGGATPPRSSLPSSPGSSPSSTPSAGSCAEVRQQDCSNAAAAAGEAKKLQSSSTVQLDTNADIPGGAAKDNVADIAAGKCPITQSYAKARTCEKNTGKINSKLVNAARTMAAMQRAVGGSITSIRVSSFAGGWHAGAGHSDFRAFDVNFVSGKHVGDGISGFSALCDAAKALKKNTGAYVVIGPPVLGANGTCAAGIKTLKGHETHFHVEMGATGVSSLYGGDAAYGGDAGATDAGDPIGD